MDTLMAIINWFAWDHLILWVLGLSSLLVVADAAGFLPPFASNWINRNQARQTIETLEKLGVDIPDLRRRNAAGGIKADVQGATLEERVKRRLESRKIRGPITVGSSRPLPSPFFIDIMGASTDPMQAKAFASDLYSHLGNLLRQPTLRINPQIDFVVTPKSGSPLLGWEFAKLLKKPCILYNSVPRFASEGGDFRARFDCNAVPSPGARALLVDDSSTGGAKAREAAEALLDAGYNVSDCLVLFEPMLKKGEEANAAKKLSEIGVALHSILKT
jgi:orotate phosphoribosyltransferase